MTGKNVNDVRFGARQFTVVRGRFRKKAELQLILKELWEMVQRSRKEGFKEHSWLIMKTMKDCNHYDTNTCEGPF